MTEHSEKDAEGGEEESGGVPALQIVATVAAVVGDIFYTACIVLGVGATFATGILGIPIIFFGLAIRQLIGGVLVYYSFVGMDGPKQLKEWAASGVETVLNPVGILFSPRTLTILAWFTIISPVGLTAGIVWAWLMHIKILRFTAELTAGIAAGGIGGVGKLAATAGKAVTATEKAVAKKLAAEAAQAGERVGSQELVRAGRGVEGGAVEAVQKGGYSPGGYRSVGVPGAPGAKPGIPETAFGMPEEPFDALKREPFAEPRVAQPGPPPLLSAEELNAKNFYERLGVSPDADPQALKEAHRSKAKTFHPDLNRSTDTNAQMRSINEAYDALKDEKKRAEYDAMLKKGGMSQGAASSMSAAETAKGSGLRDGVKHEAKKAAKLQAEHALIEKVAGEEDEEEVDHELDLKNGNGNVRPFPPRWNEEEADKAA